MKRKSNICSIGVARMQRLTDTVDSPLTVHVPKLLLVLVRHAASSVRFAILTSAYPADSLPRPVVSSEREYIRESS